MSVFRLIDAEKASYPVAVSCKVLGGSRSGYYAWRERPPSERQKKDTVLRERIERTPVRSRGTYGAPRVHAELAPWVYAAVEKEDRHEEATMEELAVA